MRREYLGAKSVAMRLSVYRYPPYGYVTRQPRRISMGFSTKPLVNERTRCPLVRQNPPSRCIVIKVSTRKKTRNVLRKTREIHATDSETDLHIYASDEAESRILFNKCGNNEGNQIEEKKLVKLTIIKIK